MITRLANHDIEKEHSIVVIFFMHMSIGLPVTNMILSELHYRSIAWSGQRNIKAPCYQLFVRRIQRWTMDSTRKLNHLVKYIKVYQRMKCQS